MTVRPPSTELPTPEKFKNDPRRPTCGVCGQVHETINGIEVCPATGEATIGSADE